MPPEDADIGRIVGHARPATTAGYVKRLGAPASDLSDDQLASTRGIRAPGWPRTGASGARPQAGAGSAGGLDPGEANSTERDGGGLSDSG